MTSQWTQCPCWGGRQRLDWSLVKFSKPCVLQLFHNTGKPIQRSSSRVSMRTTTGLTSHSQGRVFECPLLFMPVTHTHTHMLIMLQQKCNSIMWWELDSSDARISNTAVVVRRCVSRYRSLITIVGRPQTRLVQNPAHRPITAAFIGVTCPTWSDCLVQSILFVQGQCRTFG